MAGLGRYGPYLLHDGKYAKLTGTAEIFDIGMNAAVVRIAEAAAGGGRGRAKVEPLKTFGTHPVSGGEMKLMAGRFGTYVPDGTTQDRKRVVSGESVSVRVYVGGRRVIKNKKGCKVNKCKCV